MKLRKGQPRYKLPPYSRVEHVWIEGNQKHNQMCAIMLPINDITDLGIVDSKALGRPMRCAIYRNIIEFDPPPDKPYVVKVRYYPPLMEV